jgi:protein ImuB
MPLAEATATVAAHFEVHDPQADHSALLQLAAWCEQFSPIVGVEPPEDICMDVTGVASLFGGDDALAQQVVRAFKRRGYVVRVAIADTIGAAWALAHFGKESPTVVPPGQTVSALAELPVAALRVNESADVLAEVGINRIGELVMVPRDALADRFGPELLQRLDQATGAAREVISSYRPLPDIVAEICLESPAEDCQTVQMILADLIERATRSLSERQLGAIRLECKLSCDGEEPIIFVVGLFQATANAKHLLELARMQLERLSLTAPILAIRVSVLTTARLQTRQQDLFEPTQCDHRRQISQLVERLSSRLGRESVVHAIPQSEAQPELAFWYEPLTGARQPKTKPRWKALPRPLRLEREPIALEVLSVVPNGPPIQFQFGSSHRTARAWGPERIQIGWWRGRYVQRDYYRVETEAGKRFWLFRRLGDNKWFLHGVFD